MFTSLPHFSLEYKKGSSRFGNQWEFECLLAAHLDLYLAYTDLHENYCSDGTTARILFHTIDSMAKPLHLNFKNSTNSSALRSTDSATKKPTKIFTHRFMIIVEIFLNLSILFF